MRYIEESLVQHAKPFAHIGIPVGRLMDITLAQQTLFASTQTNAPLAHLSPFSVPILLEIGKERSPGQAGEMILAEAEEDLIAEALS